MYLRAFHFVLPFCYKTIGGGGGVHIVKEIPCLHNRVNPKYFTYLVGVILHSDEAALGVCIDHFEPNEFGGVHSLTAEVLLRPQLPLLAPVRTRVP